MQFVLVAYNNFAAAADDEFSIADSENGARYSLLKNRSSFHRVVGTDKVLVVHDAAPRCLFSQIYVAVPNISAFSNKICAGERCSAAQQYYSFGGGVASCRDAKT